MKQENIHAEHRKRIKERFLESGLESFSSHEILELLLFYALPYKDTNIIGHELINKYGSLSKVLDAPMSELLKEKGLSGHSAILLKLMPEISREYTTDKESNFGTISSYDEAGKYFISRFIGINVETVLAVYLDNKSQVIDKVKISQGDVNSSSVSIRKIATNALIKNASTVILAHNHPGGIPIPSSEDISVTKAVDAALNLLGINLYEHFVVAGNAYIGIKNMHASYED